MSVRSQALAWANKNKLRDGKSWNGWCQSLAWRLSEAIGHASNPPSSTAAEAARQAFKRSRNPWAAQAPAGAFHYWEIPGTTDGHVSVDLSGKGKEILMASNHVKKLYGVAMGTTDVWTYTKAVNGKYLGWSYYNGTNGYVALPKPKLQK